ncbi:hypothetical protein [Streptomyces sp. NPDC049879]|uniref:hypothetical protein n=1 Tax=Streptomyces sp. NPDC049879 TaxID=3365598 RepID=UPI0037ACF7B6
MVVAAVLAVACSPSGNGGREPVDSDPRPLSGALATSETEAQYLRTLEETAIAECMANRGFGYTPRTVTDSGRAATTNPYGLLREERAQQDGYGAVGEVLSRANGDPMNMASESDEWSRALDGTQEESFVLSTGVVLAYRPDGCAYQARETAFGQDWNRLQNELEGLQATIMVRVENDDQYAGALSDWSACMRDSGYSYADLQAPRTELEAGIDAADGDGQALRDLGREELSIATQDYECEREARLHEAVHDVQERTERSVLDAAARSDIRRYQELKQAALDRAASSQQTG